MKAITKCIVGLLTFTVLLLKPISALCAEDTTPSGIRFFEIEQKL